MNEIPDQSDDADDVSVRDDLFDLSVLIENNDHDERHGGAYDQVVKVLGQRDPVCHDNAPVITAGTQPGDQRGVNYIYDTSDKRKEQYRNIDIFFLINAEHVKTHAERTCKREYEDQDRLRIGKSCYRHGPKIHRIESIARRYKSAQSGKDHA